MELFLPVGSALLDAVERGYTADKADSQPA